VQNLRIVSTDAARGLLFVSGAVPGANGGYLMVKDAAKRKAPKDLPFPAALRVAAAMPAEGAQS
jgi:large subunit ribosomal protein L3